MARPSRLLLSLLLLFSPVSLVPSAARLRAERISHFKSPLGLAVDQGGALAYVALHTAGTLAEVDLRTGKVLREIAVGERPADVVLTRDMLYVADVDSDELAVIDPARMAVLRRIALKEAPPEIAGPIARHRVGRVEADFLLGRGEATNVRARADYKDFVFLVHQRPRNHVPATQVAQGWVFTNAIGTALNVPAALAVLDEPQRGHADPSDIVVSPDGKHLFIACAGADVVLVADRERLFKAGRLDGSLRYADGHRLHREDLTAGRQFVVARLPTQANPRRLALSGDGKTLVVSNHLADSLTVIDAEKLRVVRHIPLGGPEPDAARRGEILFNSGRMTFQGQFTCASCHPNGGSDGLTWDLERDGVGNFKRTKSLLGVRDTGPYGWHGGSPTLADRVAGTLRTLHRHEPTGTEVADLVAYLESLEPPRPLPVTENDRPAVERGQALFHGKALCSSCHQRAGLDDGKSHDVGARGPADTQDRFDTPSLRGVFFSKSFLHDGRAKSLEDVFTKHNPRQRHGATHLLNQEEFADLMTYLRSL